MKVLLLGAGSAIHTQRWANGLVQAGVQVVCVSQHAFMPGGWDVRVQRVRLRRRGPLAYFLNAREVARVFTERRCDLMNAHYATGYGMLATLSTVQPRVVSVWGSDVYDFPRASPLHRWLVRHVLESAAAIGSTSHAMARQVARLIGGAGRRSVSITPFGVDTALFTPPARGADRAAFVIGTVKVLAHKYGIDTLLLAFSALPATHAGIPVRLRIVGDGPERDELKRLCTELALGDRVDFVGAVEHARVPAELQGFDVFVAASRLDSESFGVAVIEASACGLPVVVARVGGLPEVVREGETGLIVERDDAPALAAAILRLIEDPALRERMGRAGRAWVQREYEWHGNVRRMIELYDSVVPSRGERVDESLA